MPVTEPRRRQLGRPKAAPQPHAHTTRFPPWVAVAFELALIAAWAVFVGRGYLDMDTRYVPTGSEFGFQTKANYFWTQALQCGWCALWNGTQEGGIPAFVDVHGSLLHPVVVVSTLVWGVVNGVKITLVAFLYLAGVCQWWLARELKLGAGARLWSAGIAVVGGHLASRMELGNYHLMLSTVAGSLVLVGILHLARTGERRASVLLGILGASFLLSGQGYLQIGMLGILPAAAYLLIGKGKLPAARWSAFGTAILISVLLAAPLLLPVAHFLPNLTKQDAIGGLDSAQPLAIIPLNLVINDIGFYRSEVLHRFPSPQLYSLFIGWLPVLLAVVGFWALQKSDRAAARYMAAAALLALLVSSSEASAAAIRVWPSASMFRFPSVISALAVPMLLGLAAAGLQFVLDQIGTWPRIGLTNRDSSGLPTYSLPVAWLLLIPLCLSIRTAYRFSQPWYNMQARPDIVYEVAEALKTESLQWVAPPFGAWEYIDPALAAGLKLSPGFMDVRWKGRETPIPALRATFDGQPADTIRQVGAAEWVEIYRTGEAYAFVQAGEDRTPCEAHGLGGALDVLCKEAPAGRLVVKETMWSGWKSWVDGKPSDLLGANWLEVEAPAGTHRFAFRYLPWDVPLGLVLFTVGVATCIWLWRAPSASHP